MKNNLKTFPSGYGKLSYLKWKEGFEAELRERMERIYKEIIPPQARLKNYLDLLKEILGE